MKAKTIASTQVWQSPDKQRTIWEVTVESEGKTYMLKTFSPEIAKVDFEGEVESYANARGERMVRQLKTDNYKGGNKQNNQPVIQTQWAIGQARGFIRDRGELLPEDEYWPEVKKVAIKLVLAVDEVMAGVEKERQTHGDV